MLLEGFRDLLLRKTEDSKLHLLVKTVRDDFLADLVIEALEKMAQNANAGKKINDSFHHYIQTMDPGHDPELIRDALGHHASHYKAALKTGNQELANKHMKQLFNVFNMAYRASHSDANNGVINAEAVPVQPWERNSRTGTYTEDSGPVKRNTAKIGDFARDNKGWRHDGNDFSWLQQSPHESHADEVLGHGHNGAYPLEHMKINGKHISIDDLDPSSIKGYEAHPFDHHPILKHYNESPEKRATGEQHKQYLNELNDYNDLDKNQHLNKYFDKIDALKTNEKQFNERGMQPSQPVHDTKNTLDAQKAFETRKGAGIHTTRNRPIMSGSQSSGIAEPSKNIAPVIKPGEQLTPDRVKELLSQIKTSVKKGV